MTIIKLVTAVSFAALLALPATVSAHEAAKGRNGGNRVDAGKYHAELVVDGTTAVALYLSDADDKPLSVAGFAASAILIVEGKTQRVPLTPSNGDKLAGTAAIAISPGVKGAVQITAPDGTTAQAKY